jgi:hypothetical protein
MFYKVYLLTIYQMTSSNGLLVIAIKTEGKYRFHAASILLFYILERIYINKYSIFFEDVLLYIFRTLY